MIPRRGTMYEPPEEEEKEAASKRPAVVFRQAGHAVAYSSQIPKPFQAVPGSVVRGALKAIAKQTGAVIILTLDESSYDVTVECITA